MVKLVLKEMPGSCLCCPLNWYEQRDSMEKLVCLPLSAIKDKEVRGDFLVRRSDCPLKESDM